MSPKSTQKAEVTEKINLSSNVSQFTIKACGKDYSWDPGQYLPLRIHDGGSEYPFSIASAPYHEQKNTFQIAVHLNRNPILKKKLLPGRIIDIGPAQGKMGTHLLMEDTLCIATGTGVSPFRAMFQKVFNEQQKPTAHINLLYGSQNQNEILWQKEFKEWEQQNPQFKFVPTLSQPLPNWEGKKGYTQAHVIELIERNTPKNILLCGQSEMVKSTIEQIKQLDFPKQNIHTDA